MESSSFLSHAEEREDSIYQSLGQRLSIKVISEFGRKESDKDLYVY
jgi:hypothetical protein